MKDETLKELRARAKARGVKGYSKLAKDELLRLIGDVAKTAAVSTTKNAAATPSKSADKSAATKRVAAGGKKKPTVKPSRAEEPAKELPPASSANAFEQTEQLVESAKYALSMAGPAASAPPPDLGEDIDNLPALTEAMVCLLPQKPGILHAYWHLPAGTTERDDYKLRLYRFVSETPEVYDEVPVQNIRGNHYFHVPENARGQEMAAQLGYYEAEKFIPARGQSVARLPTLYASTRTDHRWWVSDKEFAEMYQRAGGVVTPANRFGWSGSSSSSPGPSSSPGSSEQFSWPGSASSSSR